MMIYINTIIQYMCEFNYKCNIQMDIIIGIIQMNQLLICINTIIDICITYFYTFKFDVSFHNNVYMPMGLMLNIINVKIGTKLLPITTFRFQ